MTSFQCLEVAPLLPPSHLVGSGILLLQSFLSAARPFTAGIVLEWFSEEQTKAYKDDPKNKGKVYTGGLFGLARHVNYGGYLLWRTGAAMAAGGYLFGVVIGIIFLLFFNKFAIPELDEYCSAKYTFT
ncbi:hypothetical protein L218DRAFT_1010336 [Marasmius fiardii PR-910]|nr:hypothetical protein L218DRAFT_1010336 [Marasmius fiardii PR-910]